MPTDDASSSSSTEPRARPTLTVLTVSWESQDRYRYVTALAVLGVLAAAVMAVFGLPPIDLHPPWHRFGVMDPLCGGTRAARYTVQGKWREAWEYNPLGVVTVLWAGSLIVRSLVGVVTGGWPHVRIRWTPRLVRVVVAVAVVLLMLLEIRQQLRADLLIAGT